MKVALNFSTGILIFLSTLNLISCQEDKSEYSHVENIIIWYSLYDHLPIASGIKKKSDVLRSSMYPFIVNTISKKKTKELEKLINSSGKTELKDNKFGATVLCILVKKDGEQEELLVDLERKVFSYIDTYFENDEFIHQLQQIAIENLLKERIKWVEPFPFKN